ncbi:hypothetical protein TSUD_351220 [Trifolium subterraneum]|uniref:Uncharacterized protein n=1 Tax=Trifolium subterraneum TaxID=3900 RepID=A0A2Z6NXE5_TRISU|nr:hypothetical protein TSUD_351220 [Trifolium subterraneum]
METTSSSTEPTAPVTTDTRISGTNTEQNGQSQAAEIQSCSRSNRPVSAYEEDINPTQYRENRLKYLASLKTEGHNPYSHKFRVSMLIAQYIDRYRGLSDGEHLEDVSVSLAGSRLWLVQDTLSCYFYLLL